MSADLRAYAGVDPGLAAMGVARIRRNFFPPWFVEVCETVRTDPKASLDRRLEELWLAIPSGTLLAVENQHLARAGHAERGTTNAKAQMVERVMGLVWARAYTLNARFPVEVTPAFVRSCLGLPAGATKQQVRAVVLRLVTGIPARVSEHAIDAVAIAIAGERKATRASAGGRRA